MTKVLLYSGGTDSWLIKELWKPDVLLYVDMDTMYSNEEKKHLDSLKAFKEVEYSYLPLGQFEDKDSAFIPCRNMYLLLHASQYGDEICLGALKEDAGGTTDNDKGFLAEAESLISRLWARKVRIETTYTAFTKDELIKQYLEAGGDIERFKNETFSCYHPVDEKECLSCKACFRKFIACYANGVKYSDDELLRMYDYIEENVVHRSHHAEGRYFLEKENACQVLKTVEALYKYLGKELNLC